MGVREGKKAGATVRAFYRSPWHTKSVRFFYLLFNGLSHILNTVFRAVLTHKSFVACGFFFCWRFSFTVRCLARPEGNV